MIRITVCDDKHEEMNQIVTLCERFSQERKLETEIVGLTSSADVLDTKSDILILDIEMPGISGIELMEKLESRKEGPYIIFATNYEKYMEDAFGERVIGFLRKPVEYFRLEKRLDKIVTKLTYFTLITFDDGTIINSNDIVSITVNRVYSDITLNGNRVIANIRKSLSAWKSELSLYGFIQIDKSNLINCKYIETFKEWEIILKDGSSMGVSHRRKAHCWEQYLNYCKMMAKYV